MLQKKWTALFVSMLLVFTWFFLSENKVQAGCSIVCEWDMCGSVKNNNYRRCKQCRSVCTCEPLKIKCSTACGVVKTCRADGCGGQACCPATGACIPTKIPTVLPTPTPVYCGPGRPSCPNGQECYQPPMPPCNHGGCIQSMPARYCRPIACPIRSQGDANCDQTINNSDYDIYKSYLRGQGDDPNPNYSTDFNVDGKTNLVDYEIWRKSFLH